MSRFGSGTDTSLRLVLRKFGLDANKDLIVLQLGTQPEPLSGLGRRQYRSDNNLTTAGSHSKKAGV